ncbi:MAG: formyltransferase family protein [Gemmatimonadaceae bacterium]
MKVANPSKQGRCQPPEGSARAVVRVVALTAGHSFGDRTLRRFADEGIHLDALLVTVQQNAATPGAGDRGLAARMTRWRARLRTRVRAWRRWRAVARRIAVADSPSDPRLRQQLERARPDVLVLAGSGLVPSELLSIPARVTLNAHPGVLPWVRGVCPFENALLRGIPLGVTVHAVDAGIDTGPIVRRVLLDVDGRETDRVSLIRRLEDAAIGELTDVVCGLMRGEPLRAHAQGSRHPYGRWVTGAERARAVELAAGGKAARLYHQWRAAAGGDVLPDDDQFVRPVSDA